MKEKKEKKRAAMPPVLRFLWGKKSAMCEARCPTSPRKGQSARRSRELPLHRRANKMVHSLAQGSLWFVRSESLSVFPDKHCLCGHKSEAPREQKLGYNVIKALKSSVSLIGSKQRLLFKHRMKSSISVISESVTGCSSSISENSGEVNFIVFW